MKYSSYLLLAILFSGCAVNPTINLKKLDAETVIKNGVPDIYDSFYLQKSIIKISQEVTDNKSKIEVTSLPAEYTEIKFSISPVNNFGVKTNLNITKRKNTALIESIGTEVTDTRLDAITKITSIVKLAGFWSLREKINSNKCGETFSSSLNIDTSTQLASNKLVEKHKIENNCIKDVKIIFGPLPIDAIKTSEYQFDKNTHAIIYAACRDATVNYAEQEFKVKVSDPNYLQQVTLPVKGTVSFHDQCGVSVHSDTNTGISSDLAIIEALAKSIKELTPSDAKGSN